MQLNLTPIQKVSQGYMQETTQPRTSICTTVTQSHIEKTEKETVVWNSGTWSQFSLLYEKVFMTLLSPFWPSLGSSLSFRSPWRSDHHQHPSSFTTSCNPHIFSQQRSSPGLLHHHPNESSLYIISQYFFFSFIFISWRLITLQYCSGFCHT